MGKKKKYYEVIKPFTMRGKIRETGSKIFLSDKQKEILINKNLIK